jgi:hypothetical protein
MNYYIFVGHVAQRLRLLKYIKGHGAAIHISHDKFDFSVIIHYSTKRRQLLLWQN